MGMISDAIISAILKRGILGEFNKFETAISIPQENRDPITVKIKAEKLEVTIISKEDL